MANDDHRYMISTPWGDWAEADTIDAARAARRQLAQDARDHGIASNARVEEVTIVDRGYAPPIASR